jgi:hypothetical protein
MRLREFAPSGDGGGSGDYFQALASAWYNGTFDSGSLQKGIKSQQDVEQLLQRGIIGPDGVTRKYGIDYNSTFDGVVISSDDYYEHADHDETDSRTGKPFGPYDYMEFGDEELDESLNEFAADDGDSGEDDALHKYARMWWAADEATQMQIERALAKMGWEIGEDEGGYDNGGVFVVRAGDINGDSYTSWAAEDLTEGVAEGALISGDGGAVDNFRQQMANNTELAYQKGMAEARKKKKKKSSKSLRGYFFPGYGYYGSGESGEGSGDGGGGESKNRGMTEGSEDPFGPQGRFVGDTGPAQLTTTVPRVQLQIGDRVIYKPTEQRATIVGLSRDGTQARIDMPSPMGGRTFNCKVADLKVLGQGPLREKSTSQAQFRTMAAAAHDPEFAKKVGIKQSVAREFNKADKGQSYKSLPKKS